MSIAVEVIAVERNGYLVTWVVCNIEIQLYNMAYNFNNAAGLNTNPVQSESLSLQRHNVLTTIGA